MKRIETAAPLMHKVLITGFNIVLSNCWKKLAWF